MVSVVKLDIVKEVTWFALLAHLASMHHQSSHTHTHTHTQSTSRLVSLTPSGLLLILFLGVAKMYYNQTSSLPSPYILHSGCDQLQ